MNESVGFMTSYWRALLALLFLFSVTLGLEAEIQAVLSGGSQIPDPDGKVQVYVLAGQSNMVGFGYLQDAPPVYPSVYLSADPSIKEGRMPVGRSGLLKHGLFQGKGSDASSGGVASIYRGVFDEDRNYEEMESVQKKAINLGTVRENLPSIDQPHTVVVNAYLDVPVSGMFELHVGFESSSNAIATLDGEEVYRKLSGGEVELHSIALESGKRYPLQIRYQQGGSATLWMKQVGIQGKGDLRSLVDEGKYPWFVDSDGDWAVRRDVTYWETRISNEEIGSGGPLSATSNGRFIGPEVPFGFVMGEYHDEPVLLIESSMGNRSLSFDFRPPSSGKTEEEKSNEFCGAEYDLLLEGVHQTLANLDKVVPDYAGQGYEIAGFVWFQGHKDKDVPKLVYEQHLVNLIEDLRDDLNAPEMKVVIATVGFGGMDMEPGHELTWEAQMALGDPEQHPEYAKSVSTVDTRPYWRDRGESPTNTGYHYNHNAETYVLTGDEAGRAMVRLLGGKAASIPARTLELQHPSVQQVYSDEVTANFNKRGPHYAPEYYRQMGQSLKPIIADEMIPEFLETALAENSRGIIRSLTTGKTPDNKPTDLRGDLDTLIDYYDMAGLSEYQWRDFTPEMRQADWNYFSFDPVEKQPFEKSDRWREVTLPDGMNRWKELHFDPGAADWKVGKAPFGSFDGKISPLRPSCNGRFCRCSEKPNSLWEHEVLLMRQTFKIPPLQKGHAYRFILGGAGCDRTGEGFAIYVNGKLLKQVNGGFFRYTGIRGAYLFDDILPEFEGGEVTIAIMSFLRYTHFRDRTIYFGPNSAYYAKPVPANGSVSLWMQEAKLSPEVMEATQRVK